VFLHVVLKYLVLMNALSPTATNALRLAYVYIKSCQETLNVTGFVSGTSDFRIIILQFYWMCGDAVPPTPENSAPPYEHKTYI
jgi:hypothetical protein